MINLFYKPFGDSLSIDTCFAKVLQINTHWSLWCETSPLCDTNIIKWSKNGSRNTTKGVLAKDGVGLSELHVSAFYSGHHQVIITNYKRYTNMLNVRWWWDLIHL